MPPCAGPEITRLTAHDALFFNAHRYLNVGNKFYLLFKFLFRIENRMPNDKTMSVPLSKTGEIFLKNMILFCKRKKNKGQVETNLNNIKNKIIRLYLKFISKRVFLRLIELIVYFGIC